MATNFEQTPDDMRGRANQNHSVVPGYREKAKDDPDWEAQMYEGAGYGVHVYAMARRETRKERTQLGTSVVDKHEGVGDTNNFGATEFENADIQGRTGLKREPDEA